MKIKSGRTDPDPSFEPWIDYIITSTFVKICHFIVKRRFNLYISMFRIQDSQNVVQKGKKSEANYLRIPQDPEHWLVLLLEPRGGWEWSRPPVDPCSGRGSTG